MWDTIPKREFDANAWKIWEKGFYIISTSNDREIFTGKRISPFLTKSTLHFEVPLTSVYIGSTIVPFVAIWTCNGIIRFLFREVQTILKGKRSADTVILSEKTEDIMYAVWSFVLLLNPSRIIFRFENSSRKVRNSKQFSRRMSVIFQIIVEK